MKQIVCEMCESTDFLKENGIFICQGCGMKYSAEDAKQLMVEVDRPAVVNSGNNDRISNMLTLAQNAVDQANNSEAEDYANKILELDSTNAEAWLIKGRAVAWQSKLNNVRFSEMLSCFEYALKYAPEEKTESFKNIISNNAMSVSKALLNLTTGNFSKYPSADNVAAIQSAITTMLELSIKIILLHVNWDADDMHAYFGSELNSAAVNGSNKADKDYGPNESDRNKYAYDRWIQESDNCLTVLDKAMTITNSVPQIESIMKNYRAITQSIIDSCSYKFEATGYWSGYIKDYSLTDGAKASRRNAIQSFETKGRNKINEIKGKARMAFEKAQSEKNEAYWEEHAEEKAALEAEMAELKERITTLEAEVKAIDQKNAPAIVQLSNQLNSKLPEEEAFEAQKRLISDLSFHQSQLGMFKGKEKKEIEARIQDVETPKLNELKAIADAKRAEANNTLYAQMAALKAVGKEQRLELQAAQKRVKEIQTELTKNR